MTKFNKILIGIVLIINASILMACTDNIKFQDVGNENIKNEITENEEKQINQSAANVDIGEKSIIEEYKISQENNINYIILIKGDAQINDFNYTYYRNYSIEIIDENLVPLQSIELEDDVIFAGIEFIDVNLDGYLDIVINTGGTWNETHELYNWDYLSNNFVKVNYEGFDMLAWFEVYDGYIDNFIRGSTPEESVKEKLIWNGNNLVKEFEY